MTAGKKVRKGADAGGYSRAEYAGRPVNFKTGAQRLTGMTAKKGRSCNRSGPLAVYLIKRWIGKTKEKELELPVLILGINSLANHIARPGPREEVVVLVSVG